MPASYNAADTADGGDNLDREGYTFVCPQCDSRFNRLAHLRRHEMTHGGEKPYNCLYCPVASTRKDVIVRHTRNFHPAAASRRSKASSSRSAPGHRAKRSRTNPEATSHDEPSPATGHRPSWASSTAATMENDQEPGSGRNTTADNYSEETPGSSTTSHPGQVDLSAILPAHADLIDQSLLGHSPLDFTGPFMGQDFDYASISEDIDMDLLMSNPDDFLAGITTNAGKLPAAASDSSGTRLPNPRANLSPGKCQDRGPGRDIRASVDDANNEWAEALSNLARYPAEIAASFHFPSKHAARRFVSAFFGHIAPHIPIVHEPSFDIATVPSPLLLAVMACGAAYVSEQSTAVSLHSVAMRLILEHERMSAACRLDSQPPTWILQTYLLLSYYGVHCGAEGRAAHTFPNAIIRAQEALGQLKPYPITTYEEWVRQESINRCLACTIVLGATLASKEQELFVASPVMKARFALPSSSTAWEFRESEWEPPAHVLHVDDALGELFAGRPPGSPAVSDLGLLVLVSAVLYRVCALEALTGPGLADIYAGSLAERMGRPVQALDGIIRCRMGEATWGNPPDPVLQSAKSLLDSAFYHLYASTPLAAMKKLLWSPTAALSSGGMGVSSSPGLHKALTRAADQLRVDCRLGPRYLRAVAPLQYGPEGAIGPYEGGLLLFWYLEFAHPRLPQAEPRNTLGDLIDEGLLEVGDLRLRVQDRPQSLPLAVAAEMLSDGTVWKWPSAVSQRLECLIDSFKAR